MATRRDSRLSGLYPLAYLGVEPVSPPLLITDNRAPTVGDYQNFNVGTIWINRATAPLEEIWMLANKDDHVARWLLVTSTLGLALITLTGNNGIAVPGDGANNIDIIGAGPYIITGNAVTNTLTLEDDGTIATSYLTDDGNSAIPVAGVLKVYGDGIFTTTASVGDTITITGTGGGGGVLAGDNINIAPADTVNLNETIHWPDTNGTGTAGVIYLGGGAGVGGYRWLHSYTGAVDLASGYTNIFLGKDAGSFTLTGTLTGFYPPNIGIGLNALQSLSSGWGNTAVGSNALAGCTSGYANTSIGKQTLTQVTWGAWNTMVGGDCGEDITTGMHNTGIGQGAIKNLTSGWYNVAIGYDPLIRLINGYYNLCIGSYIFTNPAGYNYTGAESSNILINNVGVTGENNTMRIGTTGTTKGKTNRCFVAGIRGTTTGVADAVPVLVDSADQLGTVSSSRRYKQNIQDMQEISSSIYDLRPVTFEFKTHPDIEQYGLIAEEVIEHMPRLVVKDSEGLPETVKYHELPVLLLNEIKKLRKRIEDLERK